MLYNPPPPVQRRRGIAGLRLGLYTALVGALVTGSFVVQLPLLTFHPGPTPDVSKVITVEGPTYPSAGSMHMTTIQARPATLVRALLGWINRDVAVVPREAVYSPGKSVEEIVEENATQMDQSGLFAAISAYRVLDLLGPAEGALVVATVPGSPAAKALEPGDVIFRVDDQPVATHDELKAITSSQRVGDQLRVAFRRGGEEREAPVSLVRDPSAREGERKGPVMGVSVITSFKMPYEVKLDPQNIGGPSAGLMFSLSIVDRLNAEDLTHGYVIAGTGTIDADGNVGAVGGVAQKVEAAERIQAKYFLAPKQADEAAQARAYVDTDMTVIEVGTLEDAVSALTKVE
ncbi:MAG: YlbL family protein [Actinomycetota bacterium]